MLTAVKLVHTVIWAILAASIVAVPVAGVLRRFGWAAVQIFLRWCPSQIKLSSPVPVCVIRRPVKWDTYQ